MHGNRIFHSLCSCCSSWQGSHTHKNMNSQPRTPCRPHCPVWPHRPDPDVQTFFCLVNPNRHIIKKYMRLLSLPVTSWTSGWGETSFFKGKLSCYPTECSFSPSALAHSPFSIQLKLVYIPPHWFLGGRRVSGVAVTREEIVHFFFCLKLHFSSSKTMPTVQRKL